MMNVVIPLDPFSGDVFAYTTRVDAVGPLVILCHRLKSPITLPKLKV